MNDMKVLVPVRKTEEGFTIDEDFENASDFLVLQDDFPRCRGFNAAKFATSGEKGMLAGRILREEINHIMIPSISPRGFEVLRRMGIKAYQSTGFHIQENWQNLKEGRLKEFTDFFQCC